MREDVLRRLDRLEIENAVIDGRLDLLNRRLNSLLSDGVAPKPAVRLIPPARRGVAPDCDVSSVVAAGAIAPSEARDFTFADEAVV